MTVSPEELSDRLDAALAAGLDKGWSSGDGCQAPLHRGAFDVAECIRENHELGRGGDVCYDRPGSAFAYASWYHGERVNQLIGTLEAAHDLLDQPGELRVLDLGAGTGAVAWALAARVLLAGPSSRGRTTIRLKMVESSRPMLRLAKTLWDSVRAEFGDENLSSSIDPEFCLERWPDLSPDPGQFDLLTAHYLFDHSEAKVGAIDDGARMFVRSLRNQRVARVLISTSRDKDSLLGSVSRALIADSWDTTIRPVASGPLKGTLRRVGEFRNRVAEGATTELSKIGLQDNAKRPPTYAGMARTGALAVHAEASSRLVDRVGAASLLTDEQRQAVEDRSRCVAVRGTAGSGKSLVIGRRLARFAVEASDDLRPRTGLFVTLNESLVAQVKDWCKRFALESGAADRLRFAGDKLLIDGIPRIRFLHWDSAVPKFFEIDAWANRAAQDKLFEQARYVAGLPSNRGFIDALPTAVSRRNHRSDSPAVADADHAVACFLAEEYYSVYFGRAACSKDRYLDRQPDDRKGRVVPLQPAQRRACAELLAQIESLYLNRRAAAFRDTRRITAPFSDVFIDEAQDFTWVDFELLARVLQGEARWTIAFDSGQALRAGSTFRPPNVRPRWSRHLLKGSYRMPMRLCEALAPLADRIRTSQRRVELDEDLSIVPPSPLRISVLGSRPFVIASRSCEEAAGSIRGLVDAFGDPSDGIEPQEIVVFEKDKELAAAIGKSRSSGRAKIKVRSATVLRERGLEFPWVVWSTRTPCEEAFELDTLCYTILTRCTRHAVIWIKLDDFGDPDPGLAGLFSSAGGFWRDRLVIVDECTRRAVEALAPACG